jgi:flagellar hook-length control protein FliK
VVHAVAGVHVAAGAQGQVTIHLQPGDLGAVQVKIERAPDGTATVTVQVEKSETLQTLQQDISHLHQALDRAGVPTELRQVTLHLAPAGSTAETGTGSGNGQGPGSGQQSMGQGPGPGGGFSRGGQPQQQSRDQQATPSATNTDDDAAPHWLPVGVNITA